MTYLAMTKTNITVTYLNSCTFKIIMCINIKGVHEHACANVGKDL